MTLILIDPNLKDPHGHHMEWDLAIAAQARSRGEDVIIFAHRECPLPSKDGVEIAPLFSCTTYEARYKDKSAASSTTFPISTMCSPMSWRRSRARNCAPATPCWFPR